MAIPTDLRALTVRQTAEALNVSQPTIWIWIREGHLPSVKIGGRRLIPVHALAALLGSTGGACGGDAA